MTDFEKKLNEVKIDTFIEDFDNYETTDDEKVIIVYESYLTFSEYVYTKEGKYIETIHHSLKPNQKGNYIEIITKG